MGDYTSPILRGQSQRCERRVWLDVHGDPAERAPGSPRLTDEVREAAMNAIADLATGDEPPIWLADYCAVCPWRDLCRKRADETKAVTLLPGLQRISWEHMTRSGIHTLHQIAEAKPNHLKGLPKIGDKTARKFHFAARALLDGQPVWKQPLEAAARPPGLCLDIETEWDIAKPWSWGWTDQTGEQTILVLGREPGEIVSEAGLRLTVITDVVKAWKIIEEAANGAPIYHWGGYDNAVMKATAGFSTRFNLERQMIDLNMVLRRTVVLPLPNTSMKTVAPYLGCNYPEVGDAMTAWELYKRWMRYDNETAIIRACEYLQADVIGLTLAWRWMSENTPD